MSDNLYIWLVIPAVVVLLAVIGCGAKYFCGKRRSSDEERDDGPGYNVAMQNRLFKVRLFCSSYDCRNDKDIKRYKI